jgi:hypothetical protein
VSALHHEQQSGSKVVPAPVQHCRIVCARARTPKFAAAGDRREPPADTPSWRSRARLARGDTRAHGVRVARATQTCRGLHARRALRVEGIARSQNDLAVERVADDVDDAQDGALTRRGRPRPQAGPLAMDSRPPLHSGERMCGSQLDASRRQTRPPAATSTGLDRLCCLDTRGDSRGHRDSPAGIIRACGTWCDAIEA